jgi:DNA-directed RNA polymerase specialized sigma24 family protein
MEEFGLGRLDPHWRLALMGNREKTETPPSSEWLSLLDSDPPAASDKYSELSRGLVRYFEWNRCFEPEDMAQETLLRGFRRLREGASITIGDPRGYFWGIAYNVLREGWKPPREVSIEDRDFPVADSEFRRLNRAEQSIFLRECQDALDAKEKEMLIAYAEGRGAEWGGRNGIEPGALRLRIHRLRQRLERQATGAWEIKTKRGGSFRHI